MGALLGFQSQFTNAKGNSFRLNIGPELSPEAVDHLTCKGFVTENERDEDLFAPIKAQKATMFFRNEGPKGMTLFSRGTDNKFRTRIYHENVVSTDGDFIFDGYLVMDDIQELYVPPGGTFQLVATDNVGLLKEIELTNDANERIDGKWSIIQYICWALNKTGLLHNVVVIDNLYEQNHVDRDGHGGTVEEAMQGPLAQTFLDILTFEKDVNVKDDCYTVLSKILKARKARLTWYGRKWWITRIAEHKHNLYSWTEYGPDAIAINRRLDQHLDKMVGHANNEQTYFINERTIVRMRRPYRSVMNRFNYEFAKEYFRNSNFERGPQNFVLDGGGGIPYDVDDWIMRKNLPDEGSPTAIAYIRRISGDDGFETERYLVIKPQTVNQSHNYLESYPSEVCAKGKFTLSYDYAWGTNVSGGGSVTVTTAVLRLEGYDGSRWTLDKDGKWYESTFGWTLVKNIELQWIPDEVDETEWRNISVEAEPIPRSGLIYLMLYSGNEQISAIDNVEVRFNNLQVTYRPFVNGGYIKYNGETHKLSNTLKYSGKREDTIHIADAYCLNYKGAMTWKDGADKHQLTSKWYDWQLLHEGKTGLENTRILKWLTFDLWNHYREKLTDGSAPGNGYGARIFEASLKGMQVGLASVNGITNAYNGMIHRYGNSVNSPHNKNKKFIPLAMRVDWYTEECNAIMVEIDDTGDSNVYTGNYEFKYV